LGIAHILTSKFPDQNITQNTIKVKKLIIYQQSDS
jgi:hypothetical protein